MSGVFFYEQSGAPSFAMYKRGLMRQALHVALWRHGIVPGQNHATQIHTAVEVMPGTASVAVVGVPTSTCLAGRASVVVADFCFEMPAINGQCRGSDEVRGW